MKTILNLDLLRAEIEDLVERYAVVKPKHRGALLAQVRMRQVGISEIKRHQPPSQFSGSPLSWADGWRPAGPH